MPAPDRLRLVEEVRQRLKDHDEGGYADGWTQLHLRALLEEVDVLRGRTA